MWYPTILSGINPSVWSAVCIGSTKQFQYRAKYNWSENRLHDIPASAAKHWSSSHAHPIIRWMQIPLQNWTDTAAQIFSAGSWGLAPEVPEIYKSRFQAIRVWKLRKMHTARLILPRCLRRNAASVQHQDCWWQLRPWVQVPRGPCGGIFLSVFLFLSF